MIIPFKQIEQEQEDNTDFEETFVHTVLPDEDEDLEGLDFIESEEIEEE